MGNSYHDGNYDLHTCIPKTSIAIVHSHSGLGKNRNSYHDENYLHTAIPKKPG